MIDSLWVDAWHRFGGAVCSDENIVYDARVSGDVDRYSFSDSHHISLSINFLCSQEVNRTRLISRHGDSELSYLDSAYLWEEI
jgi:hypothetical protein